ncbi:hypothetical protein FXF51_49540 [Nonomuraea sp. PA05]|uniref:hypothetical protein n=1 Tax=Nonomuraea sp. PA05 TaxID=2604466 RepID=UPI0011D3F261|nr:hypothetical protein [Nonomuraea sp. PA05]TYB53498.1 hypothetical protein FXF51_49540 [Nonomuraea sp. PA05]
MREFEFIDRVMPDVPPATPEQRAALRARLFEQGHGSVGGRRVMRPTGRRGRRGVTSGGRRGSLRGRPGVMSGGSLGGWRSVALVAAAVILVIGAVAVLLPRSTPAPAALTPRQRLDAAAGRLAAQPHAVLRYWRQETEVITRTKGAGGYLVEERGRDVVAIGRDGDWYTWYEAVSAEPYGAEATERWRRSGSPRLCPARGCDPNLPYYPARSMDRLLAVAPGWTATLPEVLALPREASALKAELLKHYSDTSKANRDEWLAQAVRRLVVEFPTTPGTQAAAYRVLAGLPGASVRDDVRDPAGRRAVTIQAPVRGVVSSQLVIDPDSGALWAAQQVAPVPGLAPGAPDVIRSIVRRAWTDARPTPPPGCRNCSGRY